eukprot:TRINITY_DN57361_c0_g1_i1.p1 TRINITY_DN57361_c0_g1~~TRINITY_DN57361_c0_g1_i1.p1  ORF type:complete len:307 (-),score=50.57 TRINITY_DN57361_c0_g1_i1:388-1212(-)
MVALSSSWLATPGTIDWCEDNFAVHSSVAEFWNTASSGVMLLLAIAGLRTAHLRSYEPDAVRQFAALVAVAVGTAAFHGTLRYWGQMLDELSMLAGTLNWIHGLLSVVRAADGRGHLPTATTLALVVWTVTFAAVHVAVGFVEVFQIHFAVAVVAGLILLRRVHNDVFLPKSPERRIVYEYVFTLIFGFALWQVEQLSCKRLQALPVNPQLHACWHLVMGYHCYVGGMALQCAADARERLLEKSACQKQPTRSLRKLTWSFAGLLWPVCGRSEA